ncbi:DNA ligase D [Gracilibacillus halophilus]|uniref:DNA ligase D n=1 Tax=Gracilibacillus halophilus TaxID=470864 RepID=UPI0003A74870|nr:DNA ligase D [Gracilibacillus halophilus]
MHKPMLPTLVDQAPEQKDWQYEIKYDGFRCGIEWKKNDIRLWSRNGRDLSSTFPEIINWCNNYQDNVSHSLPLWLDGELVILRTPYQAIFSMIQQRGRLRSQTKIKQACVNRPASFICFDLLEHQAIDISKKTFHQRRKQLEDLFQHVEASSFQLVESFTSLANIQKIVDLHQSEGIVAKHTRSTYDQGKRTRQWLKVKNYRTIQGVITGWNQHNDYIDISVKARQEWRPIGKVKHGFTDQEKQTVIQFIQKHGTKINQHQWKVPNTVCLDIDCLDVRKEEIREATFRQFRFDIEPEDCTEQKLQSELMQFPKEMEVTKPNKLLFPHHTKRDYLYYLREIAPLLLPHLQNKRLTMIRYPDGIHGHSFYQKHVPDYAPHDIESVAGEDGVQDILCNDLRSLLWFGNHAALEFHVPFQTIDEKYPNEMVFDLDPPSRNEFPYAIKPPDSLKRW